MKRFISVFTLCFLALSLNMARASDQGFITQKFEELTKYSELAYKGFVEKNKSKGCFAEGMIYATVKLLTDEYFGDMANDQASKTIVVQQSMTQLGRFCTGTDHSFENATKIALQIKNLLRQSAN